MNLWSIGPLEPLVNKWTRDVRSLVLDEEFWIKVSKLHGLLQPIAVWISKLEGDASSPSQVCQAFKEVEQHLSLKTTISLSLFASGDKKKVMQSLEHRKEMALGSVHFAANILDPTEKGKSLSDEENIKGMEFIYELAPKFNLDVTKVTVELSEYKMNEGLFGKDFVKNSVNTISPVKWWRAICSTALLSKLAAEILNIAPTSAATERTFSTFGWIHSKKRSRLTIRRAGQLAYITHNIRLFEPDVVVKILKRATTVAVKKKVSIDIIENTEEDDNDSEEEENSGVSSDESQETEGVEDADGEDEDLVSFPSLYDAATD